jgi:hypothetical protein
MSTLSRQSALAFTTPSLLWAQALFTVLARTKTSSVALGPPT